MDDAAVLVAEHLDLDVARPDQRALDEQPPVAEGAFGLGPGGGQRGFQAVGLAHDAQAASAAAGAGFHHHGIADPLAPPRRSARKLWSSPW